MVTLSNFKIVTCHFVTLSLNYCLLIENAHIWTCTESGFRKATAWLPDIAQDIGDSPCIAYVTLIVIMLHCHNQEGTL